MAKVIPPAGAPEPPDTARHARVVGVGTLQDQRDVLLVPGHGLFLSKHALNDCRRAAEKVLPPDKQDYHVALLSEELLRELYHKLQQQEKLEAGIDPAYAQQCYPGTDTRDPQRTPGVQGERQRNSFTVDRSQSTILLTITSSSEEVYLNGSAVPHRHFVTLRLTAPDGRDYATVALTFDQFATFLVSSSYTPCTLQRFWSLHPQDVRLEEVVHPPATIPERMEQRLQGRLAEMDQRLADIQRQVHEQLASGKAMGKTALAQLQHQLQVYRNHFHSNRDFTVHQAKEEVASVVEQAAAVIAWEHRLQTQELLQSTPVRALQHLPPEPEPSHDGNPQEEP